MNKIINSKGEINNLHEINFYDIQQLCETMVNVAMENPELRERYETFYARKITKFSPELQFCIHELGLTIYDPFNRGKDEYLFSNGNRSFVTAAANLNKEKLNRRAVNIQNMGFPIMTDELLHVDKSLNSLENINSGIIDNDSYIDTRCVTNKEIFAQIYLMDLLASNKEIYEHYMAHKGEYPTTLDYLINALGMASVDLNEQGEIELSYTENVNEGTKDIVDFITEGSLVEETPAMGRAA